MVDVTSYSLCVKGLLLAAMIRASLFGLMLLRVNHWYAFEMSATSDTCLCHAHAMAFHTMLSPHQVASSWLSGIYTQPSDDQTLLFCWHRTLDFVFLLSQHAVCCVILCLFSPVDVQPHCVWFWVKHTMHGYQLPSCYVYSFKVFLTPGHDGCRILDNRHCKSVYCHDIFLAW